MTVLSTLYRNYIMNENTQEINPNTPKVTKAIEFTLLLMLVGQAVWHSDDCPSAKTISICFDAFIKELNKGVQKDEPTM